MKNKMKSVFFFIIHCNNLILSELAKRDETCHGDGKIQSPQLYLTASTKFQLLEK